MSIGSLTFLTNTCFAALYFHKLYLHTSLDLQRPKELSSAQAQGLSHDHSHMMLGLTAVVYTIFQLNYVVHVLDQD